MLGEALPASSASSMPIQTRMCSAFRALVSGFSTLLAYDRLAEELAIDERLEALERAAEQQTKR